MDVKIIRTCRKLPPPRENRLLRWVNPHFNDSNYDSIVYNPITYYPVPNQRRVGRQVLDKLLKICEH